MKEIRNIKKIFQSIVFTLFAFFIFGVINVDAKTVSVDRTSFLTKFSDKTSDVIQLSSDIDLSDLDTRYAIYIYKDKTIDLKGYDLTITERGIALWYYENATVKFIDSSNAKSGRIIREHKDGSMFADSLIGIVNLDKVNATDTFLVFDGVKIYREVDNNSIKVIAPESTTTDKTINKVSFINTDITNFSGLNDGREAKDFYYENITFKRGVVNQGFLLNLSTKTVNDVISDNSEIINETYTGTYKSTFDRTTEMSSVKTSDDVIKVRYIKGISVSNVNFELLNYKESPVSQNITITNSGQEDITITNVSVSSSDFEVTGPSSITLSSGSTDNTSWSIKPKDNLEGGTYVATITVTAGDKTYTSTVTLTVKEVDSEGNDVVYVSTKDELSSAIEAKTKYIKLADDISYNTGFVSIPVYGDVTIDLNGKTIYTKTGYFGFNYQDAATIKITDSSNAKTGKIVDDGVGFSYQDGIVQLKNNLTDTTKECNFIIDGVNVTTDNYVRSASMILSVGDYPLNSVKLINSLFSNYQYVVDGRNITNITFENVKATSGENQRIYLVSNVDGLTYGDIITDDSEVVYLEADGRYIRDASKETLVYYDTLINGQSIQVRYKSGFNVTAESKTISYNDSTDEYYIINITNRGLTNISIDNVSIDNADFELLNGNNGIIDPGKTDTSWKIKVKNKVVLEKGNHIVNISVKASDGNTYKGTFTLTVETKTLTDLGIGGIDSEIVYDTDFTPSVIGSDSSKLGLADYEISYEMLENGSYVRITEKPKNVGKYKAVLRPRGENYTFGEASVDFEIVPLTITPAIGNIISVEYNGREQTPEFTVLYGAIVLYPDKDYSYTYSDNINAGEAKVTISPIDGSNYTFAPYEKEFTINAKGLSEGNVTLSNTSYKYTGSVIKPIPVVKDGDKELVLGKDYSLSYEGDITSKGTTNAKVVVTGKGNYQNVVKVSFDIIAKDSQEISFGESNVTKTYGDSSFTIKANHTVGDGTVKYTSSNTNVAEVNSTTGTVTIKNAGTTEIKAIASETDTYGETTATYTLKVDKKKISIYRAAAISKEYDGTKIAEVDYIMFNGLIYGDDLEQDVDYTATAEFDSEGIGYSKPVTIKVVLKPTAKSNNYNLSNPEIQTRANINGKTIKKEWITLDKASYTYNGSSIEPVVTIKDPTGETVITLTKGTHYTVEYSNNLNAGEGKIIITGMSNYAGEIEKEFTINKKTIMPTIEDIPAVTYNGREHTPNLVVKDGSTPLVIDRDYIVEYTNNLRAGQGHVSITEVPSSNYTFASVGTNFIINKYEIKETDVTLEYTSIVFDGNAKKPNVTVKMGNEVIEPNEYTVDYINNTNKGTASVKVIIKSDSDDFTGNVTKYFEIVDKLLVNISGISNQQVVYTGNPVELVGNLTVDNGLTINDLTTKWYKDGTEITRPTNVGVYKVVYSYEDETHIGNLTVEFEITKKTSTIPSVSTYKGLTGDKLSTITLPDGFKWLDSNETITKGTKNYNATYTTNNDTTNYTTETLLIEVYGKSKVNLTTSVNGLGGTISSNKTDILEGTTESITFSPSTGFEINKVLVNGVDKTTDVVNNKLDVVIGSEDVNVTVTYKVIQYTITINGTSNVTITPSGIIKVDYNTNKTITIIADTGYNLVSVKVNGIEKISELVNDELTLENILEDTEIVVVVERNMYEVIEGADQKYIIGKNNEAKFKIDSEFIKFERGGSVYVDGELLDTENYTSESGSTIITLKKEYMDTLKEGKHTLKVMFNDGEATTTFTILRNEENPKTNDNIGTYIISGIISSLTLIGLGSFIYKRKQFN